MDNLAQNLVARTLSLYEPPTLVKRVTIPTNSKSPQGLKDAVGSLDPFSQAGKYAVGWVYFCIILLVATALMRIYYLWTDKMRRALYKEEVAKLSHTSSPDTDYEMANISTARSEAKFFHDSETYFPPPPRLESSVGSITMIGRTVAIMRYFFYRPLPTLTIRKRVFQLPTAGAALIVFAALAFVVLYTFVPQPYFYSTIAFGSPPLAVRAGMLSVAMVPWIVALSMKANFVSLITGIGHERLNVLHRWGGYICLLLALVHTVPYYIQPVWDQGGSQVFLNLFNQQFYIYGTGIAALTPLAFLCVHSLPMLRSWAYELFVVVHAPVAMLFLAMMFWHCNNYLTSWSYLWATVAIWVGSLIMRLFYLNWANFRRMSWLVGDEAAVTIMPENAIKVTIPTQTKWRPGQFVYLRIPGISFFENHPFTIASLCSDEFLSEYGEQYRDMTLVFRPFGGFTRKVLTAARQNGPEHTYRAFIDGPYGGMTRELASFDSIVFFAGGSGITAIVSHLLDLIKRMREGTAVTKQIHVVWALKRPEIAEWFKEELRICRQFAPVDSVRCQFYITAAKRQNPNDLNILSKPPRPTSTILHDRVNEAFQGLASKRCSAIIRDEAQGDSEKEKQLLAENQDAISALPQAHVKTHHRRPTGPGFKLEIPKVTTEFPPPPQQHQKQSKHQKQQPQQQQPIQQQQQQQQQQEYHPQYQHQTQYEQEPDTIATHTNGNSQGGASGFDFGFPSTPTVFQKNLMRFAFLPTTGGKKGGWQTEYGRPDIPFMLRGFQREFGRKTCVFVCGPTSMRLDVQRCVARMQRQVLSGGKGNVEEIFLHTENYAL